MCPPGICFELLEAKRDACGKVPVMVPATALCLFKTCKVSGAYLFKEGLFFNFSKLVL